MVRRRRCNGTEWNGDGDGDGVMLMEMEMEMEMEVNDYGMKEKKLVD